MTRPWSALGDIIERILTSGRREDVFVAKDYSIADLVADLEMVEADHERDKRLWEDGQRG